MIGGTAQAVLTTVKHARRRRWCIQAKPAGRGIFGDLLRRKAQLMRKHHFSPFSLQLTQISSRRRPLFNES